MPYIVIGSGDESELVWVDDPAQATQAAPNYFGSGGEITGSLADELGYGNRRFIGPDGQFWLQIGGDPATDPRLAPYAVNDPERGWIAPQNIMAELNPEPNSFGDKWGAFPMLAAVIGGAMLAPATAGAGVEAAGSAAAEAGAAGGAAGGSTVAGLPAGATYSVSTMPEVAGTFNGINAGGSLGLNAGAGGIGAGGAIGSEIAAIPASMIAPSSVLPAALAAPVAAALAAGGGAAGGAATGAGMGALGSAAAGAAGTAAGNVLAPAGTAAGNAVGSSILDRIASGALPAAASLGGALIASNSADKAIEAQTQGTQAALAAQQDAQTKALAQQAAASQSAIDELRRQYDTTRADFAPYREAGNQAVGRISGMLAPGGDLTRKFTVGDFYADPVTQLSMDFGLSEGRKALERAARANGSLNSGGTLKALTRYGTDYAGQRAGESYNRFYGDQDRIFNRNASLAGLGQTATSGTASLGQGTASGIAGITTNAANNAGNILTSGANTIGGLYAGLGNSRGAASIAQGNTFNNALSNIGNWWTNQNMLDTLLAARK